MRGMRLATMMALPHESLVMSFRPERDFLVFDAACVERSAVDSRGDT